MKLERLMIALLSITVLGPGAALLHAGAVSIDASQRGWVCDAVNTPCNEYGAVPAATLLNNGASPENNYFAGEARYSAGSPFDAGVYRDWFEFQIPVFSDPLGTAVLSLDEPYRYGGNLTFYLIGLAGQPATFADDLGPTGTLYGSVNTSPASIGTTVTIQLNAAGLAAIAAHQGQNLFFGGYSSGESVSAGNGYAADFSGTGLYDESPTVYHKYSTLIVTTTPEPGSVVLMGAGLALVAAKLRRARR